MTDTERFVLRVWLPDRPGALGAVASRIGAVGGDVTAIEIVDRGGGSAIDELAVELPPGRLDLALREIGAVDGVRVESSRTVMAAPPDPRLGTLDAAHAVVTARSTDALRAELCRQALSIVAADWAVVASGAGGVVNQEGEPPQADWLAALVQGTAELPSGPVGNQVEEEIAFVHLDETEHVLVVGRVSTPLRNREAHIIRSLGELAAARWRELQASARV
jgi:hypothetical protein